MISSITFRGDVQPEKVSKNNITTPYSGRSEENTLERVPAQDSFDNKITPQKVAIASIAAIGLAAAADAIFNHGKTLKKIFGKAEKTVAETKPDVKPEVKPEPKPEIKPENKDYENWLKEQDEAKKVIEESNQRNEKWIEEQHKLKENEYSDWWNKELKAKEEAKEKLKKEYIQGMDEIARKKAIELQSRWNAMLDIYTGIYSKGFKALSKGKKVTVLEDGTHKITAKYKNRTCEYYSKDGINIDEIRTFNPSGKVNHKVYFGRDNGRTGNIEVFNCEGKRTEVISFDSDITRNRGNRISSWNRTDISYDGELNSLYLGNKTKIEWHSIPSEEIAGGLALNNWVKL